MGTALPARTPARQRLPSPTQLELPPAHSQTLSCSCAASAFAAPSPLPILSLPPSLLLFHRLSPAIAMPQLRPHDTSFNPIWGPSPCHLRRHNHGDPDAGRSPGSRRGGAGGCQVVAAATGQPRPPPLSSPDLLLLPVAKMHRYSALAEGRKDTLADCDVLLVVFAPRAPVLLLMSHAPAAVSAGGRTFGPLAVAEEERREPGSGPHWQQDLAIGGG
ncbi:hypothetical protein PR202_ga18653 [Eleusine coracana subsp. coracana]|uniref:Uncharacterized protein n=1 Tax=Eleusine coracana subsp. coracana TaxID=191504 RepID=A0AAV5CTS5_ELECO|nr:hypothetical protein PR202_ga18653 [Eleusine coracana subsp. coracana]